MLNLLAKVGFMNQFETEFVRNDTNVFPKTLEIRNTVGGMIWQIYHVQSEHEIEVLKNNSRNNGFLSQTVVDYTGEKETFPRWRNEVEWTNESCPRCITQPCSCVPDDENEPPGGF